MKGKSASITSRAGPGRAFTGTLCRPFAVLQHRRVTAVRGKGPRPSSADTARNGTRTAFVMFRNGEEDRQHAPAAIDHLDAPLPRIPAPRSEVAEASRQSLRIVNAARKGDGGGVRKTGHGYLSVICSSRDQFAVTACLAIGLIPSSSTTQSP
jgi:hypothetical protein